MIQDPKHIVISRTDSIGDVCLTLPLAGILKRKFPNTKITFLGNTYTQPVIACCSFVDEIWEWANLQTMEETAQIDFLRSKNIDVFIHVFPRKDLAKLAKKAGIAHRIGTSHRLFHLLTCNHRPGFTRKNSDLHEAQLNTKLLAPLGITNAFSLAELATYAGFNPGTPLPERLKTYCPPGKKLLVLHPKSQGSAREWPLEQFMSLAHQVNENEYTVVFTGTEKEGLLFRNLIPSKPNVHDLTGQMTLPELISFIAASDFLVAASTGPLHLAGLTNIQAIGLFSLQRPIHAGRWKPLGNKVIILEEKNLSPSTQPLSIPLRDVMRALEQGV